MKKNCLLWELVAAQECGNNGDETNKNWPDSFKVGYGYQFYLELSLKIQNHQQKYPDWYIHRLSVIKSWNPSQSTCK